MTSEFESHLGISKPASETRVVVAMSGGVDSSVVAAKLYDEGYEVIGITLQLYDHGAILEKKGACCAGRDIHDARRIAEQMGFPHYVLDYESHFRTSVIDEFVSSYTSGYTPVPCIRCNERVKFRDLMDTARDLGADCLATGHYIRRIVGRNGNELHTAADPQRDQSYFLFSTTPEQLSYLRFPLGSLSSKSETREMASRYGLSVAEKPDSQDICFVPSGNYSELIQKLRPDAGEPGEIVDIEGNVVGSHSGIINFTIGQRRRLGISGSSEPLYVVRLEPGARRVVVGPRSSLRCTRFNLEDVNWLGDQQFCEREEWRTSVKIRSTRPPREAIIRPLEGRKASIEMLSHDLAVAPGQACVFYETGGTRVFGGGWITRDHIE